MTTTLFVLAYLALVAFVAWEYRNAPLRDDWD